MKLCCIGGGKMAEALLGGLLSNGWATASELGVVETGAERRDLLAKRFGAIAIARNTDEAIEREDFCLNDLLIAVKPQHVDGVMQGLVGLSSRRVLSIAAGVRIASLSEGFGEETIIVRAMPNTPALVGVGAAAIAVSENATSADAAWAASILSSVGTVVFLEESALDAVTGVSGSGPAYVFLLAEAMICAGIDAGLAPEVADRLVRQTVLGAATLLSSRPDSPAELRENVTSPGGTTAAALAEMYKAGLPETVVSAVGSAVARSIELGA